MIFGRRPVWVIVTLPRGEATPAVTVRERRWLDDAGNQWRTDDRPLPPAPIVDEEPA